MKLYEINEEYTNYLISFDSTVMYKKDSRKYVGVVLKIGDYKYFAPLTSPKTKHKKMSNSLKVMLIYSKGQHIGTISISNMIPVLDYSVVTSVNIKTLIISNDIDIRKYGMLLSRQIKEINKQNFEKELLRKAHAMYQNQIKNYNQNITNFRLLEEKIKEYKLSQKIGSPQGTTFKL